jgi:hypothetical protein
MLAIKLVMKCQNLVRYSLHYALMMAAAVVLLQNSNPLTKPVCNEHSPTAEMAK